MWCPGIQVLLPRTRIGNVHGNIPQTHVNIRQSDSTSCMLHLQHDVSATQKQPWWLHRSEISCIRKEGGTERGEDIRCRRRKAEQQPCDRLHLHSPSAALTCLNPIPPSTSSKLCSHPHLVFILSLFSYILPPSLPRSLLSLSLTRSFLLPQIKLYRGRIHGQPTPLPLTPLPLSHLIARCCHHSCIHLYLVAHLHPSLPPSPLRASGSIMWRRWRGRMPNVAVDGINKQTIQTVNVTTRVFLYFP